jgi:hypothetical protein
VPDSAWVSQEAGTYETAKPVKIDTSRPHSARMYDYYLGGKDNYAVDREAAEEAMRSWTSVRTAVREAYSARPARWTTSPNWRSLDCVW